MKARFSPASWLCQASFLFALTVLPLAASKLPLAAQEAEHVQLLKTPHGGIVPDAEVDADGVLHLAYVRGEDAYYVSSLDEGKTFAEPIRINSEPGTAFGHDYRGPDIAIGQNGRVHAIWYTNAYQRKLPKDQWGVHYAYLDSSTGAFVPARNFSQRPSDNYSLAADTSGAVAVFWTAEKLFVNLSQDNGKTFSRSSAVSGADACECCASRAVFSSDGALHCAYRDNANDIRDMVLVSLPKGKQAFGRSKISPEPWRVEACPMTGTYLTSSPRGLVAAWEMRGKVLFGRLDPRGPTAAKNPLTARTDKGKWPLVLAAPDGAWLVAYKQGSELVWELYGAKGNLAKGPTPAPSNSHRFAGVVTKDGRFLLIH